MGLIYRTDVLQQYGIAIPTTWAEYEAAGEALKAAGGPLLGDLGANVPAVFMALTIQNGAQPFTYDPTKPEDIPASRSTTPRRRRCSTTGLASSRRVSSARRTSSPPSTSPGLSVATTPRTSRLPGLPAT